MVKRAKESAAEREAALLLRAAGLSEGMVREHRFHPERRWRFDFAWPAEKVAVEVDGLLPGAGGRHQRMAGIEGDHEKKNAAQLLGWRVFCFSPRQVRGGGMVWVLRRVLSAGISGLDRGEKAW